MAEKANIVMPLLSRLEEIYDDFNTRASYDAKMKEKADTMREAIMEICKHDQSWARIREIIEHVSQMVPPKKED